jgi:hypothetical protein
VAYFLRDHAGLIQHTPHYQRSVGDAAPDQSPPVLYIKTGSLVDPSGVIPRALMMMPIASYPTRSTAMYRTGPHALAGELLLAAFNASLVSVSLMPSLNGEGRSSTRQINLTGHMADGPFTCSVLRYERSGDPSSDLMPLLPIEGLGIVRAVDPVSGYIHIVHPPSVLTQLVTSSSSRDLLPVLSRGPAAAPQALTYAPSLPLHPFASSDVVGEGAASMKARYILKRRSQHTAKN